MLNVSSPVVVKGSRIGMVEILFLGSASPGGVEVTVWLTTSPPKTEGQVQWSGRRWDDGRIDISQSHPVFGTAGGPAPAVQQAVETGVGHGLLAMLISALQEAEVPAIVQSQGQAVADHTAALIARCPELQ